MTDVAKLRALLASATPGPWLVPEPTDAMTCVYTEATNVGLCLRDHDAALIAAAVNALPALLDVVEAAEQRATDLAGRLDESVNAATELRTENVALDMDKRDLARRLAAVEGDAASMADWILRGDAVEPNSWRRDHACAQCVPAGPIVVADFECGRHVAMRIGGKPTPPAPRASQPSDALTLDSGSNTPWPMREVLATLADAAEHLLGVHSCDAHGYEGVTMAVRSARAMLAGEPFDMFAADAGEPTPRTEQASPGPDDAGVLPDGRLRWALTDRSATSVVSPTPRVIAPGDVLRSAPEPLGYVDRKVPAPVAGEAARELRVVLEPLYRQLARIQSITMPGVHAELAACNKRIQSTIDECIFRREAGARTERAAAHRAEVAEAEARGRKAALKKSAVLTVEDAAEWFRSRGFIPCGQDIIDLRALGAK